MRLPVSGGQVLETGKGFHSSSPPQTVVRIAVYGALAVGLYTVENLIPSPLPWLRVGASNIAILLALYDLGTRGAVAVFLLKLLLGSILVGRFLTPFFWFAAFGGCASLLAMVLARMVAGRFMSIVGVSVIGGVFHNTAQLVVARLVMVPSNSVWFLLPVLELVGVVSGALVGVAARLVQLKLTECSGNQWFAADCAHREAERRKGNLD